MNHTKSKGFWALTGLAGAAALAISMNAQAVPSFARQTGMPCQACHTVFPELTAFGREFKLNGYTLTGIKQITSNASGTKLKINEIPPLSAMLQVGFTHVAKTSTLGGVQNNNVEFPQQLSLFYAGEISPHMGIFSQITMGPGGGFEWDNTDVRMAFHTNAFGGDTVYGLTLNNVPTVSDLWNSTPAWGYPFAASDTAPGPAYAALITDMGDALGGSFVGLGAYTMINGHLYVEADAYRQAIGGGANALANFAPYWRVAWQQNLGPNYIEVGTFGMYAKVFGAASPGGPTDKFTDVGVDAQYERPVTGGSVSAHMTYIYEHAESNGAGVAANPAGTTANGNTFKLDGTYHYHHMGAATVAYFQTTGSATLLGGGETRGYTLQASYLPWENTKFTLQYTGYTSLDGNSTGASDNNSLYLLGWLMY
jgi:hypothetical protein